MIVDDHEVVRNGMVEFLDDAEIEVVATSGDASEAVRLAGSVNPDVVLLDVRLGDFDGLWALEQIKLGQPNLPVVLFSSYDNPTYIARAIALGASDYLLKNANRSELMDAIRRGVEGYAASSNGELERVRRSMEVVKKLPEIIADYALTQREVQVLRHVGLGLSNKEIAKSLEISIETVKEHVQNILRKTKAADRTDLAVRTVRWGLVD
jgi:DNA-binding NarL/FixJ family response regulator